jgi:hypothetical protein
MNAGHGALNVGNPPNMTIGRTMNLITVNLARYIQGVSRNDAGHPFYGLCIAEDESLLPPGWESLREEYGYGKDESALGKGAVGTSLVGTFAPSSFRSFVGEGQGGIAVRLGVSGPGKYNFMEYICSYLTPVYAHNYGWCIIMHGNMASSLYTYGFQNKAAVYEWMWKTYTITAEEYRKYGYYDVATNNGTAIEPSSGMPYKDLPPTYPLPVYGKTPFDNCIIVSVTPGDEVCWGIGCVPARPVIYPIEPWK